jgi:hypothetical protein
MGKKGKGLKGWRPNGFQCIGQDGKKDQLKRRRVF